MCSWRRRILVGAGEVVGRGIVVLQHLAFLHRVGVGAIVGLNGHDIPHLDALQVVEEGVVVPGQQDGLAFARDAGAAVVLVGPHALVEDGRVVAVIDRRVDLGALDRDGGVAVALIGIGDAGQRDGLGVVGFGLDRRGKQVGGVGLFAGVGAQKPVPKPQIGRQEHLIEPQQQRQRDQRKRHRRDHIGRGVAPQKGFMFHTFSSNETERGRAPNKNPRRNGRRGLPYKVSSAAISQRCCSCGQPGPAQRPRPERQRPGQQRSCRRWP